MSEVQYNFWACAQCMLLGSGVNYIAISLCLPLSFVCLLQEAFIFKPTHVRAGWPTRANFSKEVQLVHYPFSPLIGICV